MTKPPAVASPDAAVSSEFAELASDERIAKAAAALERNGIRPLLAATGADARGLVGSLLVDGAEVYNNTSQTLEAIGVAGDIERSGRYQPLRLRLYRMDREMQRREMRALTLMHSSHPGCGARVLESLAQLRLGDLPHGVLRQHLLDVHLTRHLVAREGLAAVLDEVLGHHVKAGPERHEGHRLLAEDRIGLPDDRGLEHRGEV